ncbi:hypothetical protein BGM19_26625 [Streptomyces agglomeratus]|uniref:hypothetical protein n=1 Tax=Streptomyces agglomeratus TaxID=285458 RepID=UPI00086F00C0|nr:hypothetical protein [Streptomyces agglomeratus]OEJ61053.1 hypothetical protein BGM19_26625 [Streptomyces agglomeratus]
MTTAADRRERTVASDASPQAKKTYTVDDFFDCLRGNPRWAPKILPFRVQGEFVETDEEECVTILVVPTAIRTIYDYYAEGAREEHEAPEYEFEGWLVGDYPRKVWVIGTLLANGDVCLYRLEPGEELGTAFSALTSTVRTLHDA